jgi:hypothetical protein
MGPIKEDDGMVTRPAAGGVRMPAESDSENDANQTADTDEDVSSGTASMEEAGYGYGV